MGKCGRKEQSGHEEASRLRRKEELSGRMALN